MTEGQHDGNHAATGSQVQHGLTGLRAGQMGEDNRINGKPVTGFWLVQDNVAVKKMVSGQRFHVIGMVPEARCLYRANFEFDLIDPFVF